MEEKKRRVKAVYIWHGDVLPTKRVRFRTFDNFGKEPEYRDVPDWDAFEKK